MLLDEFGSDNPNDYIAGFPPHPHRGFETITYMINGKFTHKDTAGNEGHLSDGGVQWMTAGKGVIHSEMPEQTEGLVRGFQLWFNLPKEKKMIDPAYHDIQADQIPIVELEDEGQSDLRNLSRYNWSWKTAYGHDVFRRSSQRQTRYCVADRRRLEWIRICLRRID